MTYIKPKTATVERHRYVLDWFERDQVELELKDTVYEFNYRFGPDWYLQAKRHDGDRWQDVKWDRGDFNIADPAAALVALGDHVTTFTAITSDMQFHKALAKLLADAQRIKAGQAAREAQS